MDCTTRRESREKLEMELSACASLPIEWSFGEKPTDGIGGGPVVDPGTIHVAVGTDREWAWDEGQVFQFTLRGLVADVLDGWQYGERIDIAHMESAKKLVAELRSLAELVESNFPTEN